MKTNTQNTKPPIINCHTHIFKGENIPPYIAKTFVPWPLYYLLSIPAVLRICKWWYTDRKTSPTAWKHKAVVKKMSLWLYSYRALVQRHVLTDVVAKLLNFIITFHALVYVFFWFNNLFLKTAPDITKFVTHQVKWLQEKHLLYLPSSSTIKFIIILFTVVFIAYGRKFIWFVLKKFIKILSFLPSKETLAFAARYINIGRFAYYNKQYDIFRKLKNQYPNETGFVVLPMDMEFMGAGKLRPKGTYEFQMQELAEIKESNQYKHLFFPFVFVDPRREKVGQQPFFDWQHNNNGSVILNPCFIKTYIEEKKFSGFKIYPALGYYPFDERLLPLWKYAADNQIPILTHAIRGTIYYRGTKEKAWSRHLILKQADGKHLLLPQLKNIDFINNFTHPLNYLCLVEEKLLRLLVAQSSNSIKELFGYTDDSTPLLYSLKHLKLCFGHYGGDEEWQKYFEKDRDQFVQQLVTKPTHGLNMIKEGKIDESMNLLEQVWLNVDWYTIISSMMLQYPNLYADISYIIHNDDIVPLLKHTIQNSGLKAKVLFGTDFYVVRNHKSEKEMLAEIQAHLTEDEFDEIARINPRKFLNLP